MVDKVVLVTQMAISTIFWRQGHATSGFKQIKTEFESISSRAHKTLGSVSGKVEVKESHMTLGCGVENKKAECALKYGEGSDRYHVIELKSALCWSDVEVITDNKKIVPKYVSVNPRVRVQWTSSITLDLPC